MQAYRQGGIYLVRGFQEKSCIIFHNTWIYWFRLSAKWVVVYRHFRCWQKHPVSRIPNAKQNGRFISIYKMYNNCSSTFIRASAYFFKNQIKGFLWQPFITALNMKFKILSRTKWMKIRPRWCFKLITILICVFFQY